jgi:hypothetical protein
LKISGVNNETSEKVEGVLNRTSSIERVFCDHTIIRN